jgi:catechol 2,3-dioxygenase-like lactoylglutathione lyase family enzyme
MTATSINHVSIHAEDLEQSAAFYERLFGMQRIPAPTFAVPVVWLRLGHQQLHLFVRPEVQAPRFHHVGLNVDDFEAVYWRALEQRLDDESAFFSGIYELPDGAVQMYLRDPADNLVEVDWPDARTLDTRIRRDVVRLSAAVAQTAEALTATLFLDRRDDKEPHDEQHPRHRNTAAHHRAHPDSVG